MDTTFPDRLRSALAGETAYAFAKRAKINDSTFRSYLDGTKQPGMDMLLSIANAADVSLDWLVAERGQMKGTQTQSQTIVVRDGALPAGSVAVGRLSVEASAGSGIVPQNEEITGVAILPEDWLRSYGVNPAFARILKVRGNSNEPTIRDGDDLIVDTSIRSVLDDRFYIVVIEEMVLVKRVQVMMDGDIIIKSDNPSIAPQTIRKADLPRVHIAGRVAYYGRGL